MSARILVAKPGLDGHDRGAKIVARALRDAGFEVIYTGIRQKVEDIVSIAVQEDVAVVGLSILSGAHVALTTKVVEQLRAADAGDIAVIVGHKRAQPILDGLKEAGFPMENAHRVDSLDASTALLATIAKPGDTVLYENDLPDHYQEA